MERYGSKSSKRNSKKVGDELDFTVKITRSSRPPTRDNTSSTNFVSEQSLPPSNLEKKSLTSPVPFLSSSSILLQGESEEVNSPPPFSASSVPSSTENTSPEKKTSVVKKSSLPKTSMLSEEEKAKYIAMNKLLKKYETEHHPMYIPLPYAAGKNIVQSPCSALDQLTPFGRAGLLPFTRRGDQIIVFFNLFRGSDRGMKVMELSDLAGRIENGENFVRGACQEAYEETLGIFNFLGQESNIRKLSQVSYNEDRSVITMAVPITLNVNPADLVILYSQVKKDINGPPLPLDLLPPKNLQPQHILNRNYGLSTPKLGFTSHPSKKKSLGDCFSSEDELSSLGEVDGDKIERKGKFNANETADLVFLTLDEIRTLLAEKECLMSEELNVATRHTYIKFPPLYFAIAKHLSALLPFMEAY